MGHIIVYILFVLALTEVSLADNVNKTNATRVSCLNQENVINTSTIAETCFKDLVQMQIQNNTNTSTCTNFNDFTTRIESFYNFSTNACYTKGLQRKYAPAKPILLKMFELIFKGNRLKEILASNQFSCLNDKEVRGNITKCISFKYLRSNNTSNAYIWVRRAMLNFTNMACMHRASKMKKCTSTALVAARCQEPVIELTNSMFDIVISNCNHTQIPQKETGKGASSHPMAFSCISLLFTGLIYNIVNWLIM